MNLYFDVAVIGGGAAGMAAAVRAAERKKRVLLLEKADRPGRKVLASGNGRCNLMNTGTPKYFGDAAFASQVLGKCTQEKLASFFRKYGLMLTVENDGLVYPATYQAASVVSVLKNALSLSDVTVRLNTRVICAEREDGRFAMRTEDGNQYQSERIIIACGGAAQPKLGGSYDGYQILESFGHRIIPVIPSLVPMITDEKSISGLSGTRIRCTVSLQQKNETIHTEEGEVLFTDYGISGICVMQCARFVSGTDACIRLDFLHRLFPDRMAVSEELKRRKKMFSSCSPIWLLNGILPEKLAFAVLKQAGIALHGETAAEIDDGHLERIIDTASGYRIGIRGNRGFEYAQVTAGGADCIGFDPSTMESRFVPGLYAAGEILNVDGDCGGYNLMFAFASGLLAGSAV